MPAGNVELVRHFYDALNANDLADFNALCDGGIEYVNPDVAAEPGTRRGPEAFRSAFEGLHASFEHFRCEIDASRSVPGAQSQPRSVAIRTACALSTAPSFAYVLCRCVRTVLVDSSSSWAICL